MYHRWSFSLVFAFLFLIAMSASAATSKALDIPSGTYKNDPAHTSLTWRIGHMGLSNFTARVNDVTIDLELDASDLTKSRVEATIDPASVDTGYPFDDKSFDEEVGKDSRFLNSPKFPVITFVSTSIVLNGDGLALIDGDLTLLGVTQSITLTGVLNGTLESHPFAKKPAVGFTATTSIDRTDFGLNYLSGAVLSDEVEIIIQAEFIKQ